MKFVSVVKLGWFEEGATVESAAVIVVGAELVQ